MPIFGNRPAGDSASWEPEAADSRLAHTAGADPAGVFTSDLSVAEYVLLGEAGFEPLGFVVGSSIYHIGLQVGRWSQNQELQILTQAMYNAREFVQLGGLIAYGASISDLYRSAATYVDKLLKGTKRSNLPIERPTKFELFINRTTAKGLGIGIPQTLLASADDLIE